MNLSAILDPLFLMPFLNGLILALLLPTLGGYVRLREEWLASLGLAEVVSAGVVLGTYLLKPLAVLALGAAVLAAALKAWLGRSGNDNYAVMILFGWAAALLGAANGTHGEEIGRSLISGQIYFTNRTHFNQLLGLGVACLGALPLISQRILRNRIFPEHQGANGRSWSWSEILFDVILAVALALASTVIGVMAAFALIFAPTWVAFRFARGWRDVIVWSAAGGIFIYLLAFAGAIALDQPFGPLLVLGLVGWTGLRRLPHTG